MIRKNAIHLTNVSKSFLAKNRATKALNCLSLSVAEGEVIGILGENGAGKSTLVNLISTQLAPDEGQISVLGLDTATREKEIRARINLVEGGDKGLYPWLSALENLQLFALLYRVPKVQILTLVIELLTIVELEESAWNTPVMTLSKGMKQRVLLAKVLVNDPELILLDEPTVGLDLHGVKKIRTLVRSWAKSGKTCVITSHNIGDIDAVCDRVAVIRKGELKGLYLIEELRSQYRSIAKLDISSSFRKHKSALIQKGRLLSSEEGKNLAISLEQGRVGEFYEYVSNHYDTISNVQLEHNSLEEFYIQLMEEA